MIKKLKSGILYILILLQRTKKHHMTAFSGQMAYFFALSIFPMMIFIFSVLSKLNLNYAYLYQFLIDVLPSNISSLIVDFTEQSIQSGGTALLSVSGIFMLYSSSRGVGALQRAINAAHGFEERRNFVMSKLYGMFYTLMFIALIVVSLLIPAIGTKLIQFLNGIFSSRIDLEFINTLSIIRNVMLPVLYVVVIGSIYIYLPNPSLTIRQAYKGAIFSIVASFLANYVFSTVVVKVTDYSILYGSLSAMIAFMVWLYILSTILMLGAEINAYEIEKASDTTR